MIFITHVRMAKGTEHEHISDVKWRDENGKIGSNTVKEMVDLIKKNKVVVNVKDGEKIVPVVVVDDSYLRTKADGKLTNNLLSLPRF
ncbi:DUF3892 domain-containing protein [Chondromyces crocatus]|uniref:DUF3892 domain-containing protein n=1 Tax=Chondromyces crocatus TaxID=52 RepID=A0A0K1ESJ4_CHOCO|nr:DUF3892 domain-containing protein [Chondromyces crocatus]AKT43910.1 uncharacterized protein CMC5_081470 [Chondromyces crocatus]